jgi:hypothetical protein
MGLSASQQLKLFLARISSTLKMEATIFSGTSVLKDIHGASFQKTAFFIVTAVETSNLT